MIWFLLLCTTAMFAHCKQLMMIQQTFRHGARFPAFPNASDYSDIALKMNSIGQLTNQGKNMHYLLGKIIYDKYWQLLFSGTQYQNMYHQSQFYIKSTDVNRTLQSAQSHMFGLLEKLPKLQLNSTNYQYSLPQWKDFQASTNVSQVFQIFETGPAFHPVAIHTQKRGASRCDSGDYLTKYDEEACPNQKFWISQNTNSDEVQHIKRDPRIKQAIQILAEQINQQVPFQEVYMWKDSFTCLKYLGYPRIKAFDNPKYAYIYDFIQTYTTYQYLYSQPDQIRAIATNYFIQTMSNFEGKLSKKFTPRIVIYSGHDTTIGMILAALNMTNPQCIVDHYLNGVNNSDTCIWQFPPYTTNIIFQLWNNNGQYSISMLYNGEARRLPICDYKLQCSLQQFGDWLNKFKVQDVSTACGYVRDQKVFYAVIFLLLSSIVAMIFYIVFLHAKIHKIDTVSKAKKQGYIENFQQKQNQIQLRN